MVFMDLQMQITCPKCKNVFTKRNNLYTHMRNIHNMIGERDPAPRKRSPQMLCSICGCTFVAKSSLNRHMRKMHELSQEDAFSTKRKSRIKCSECDSENLTSYEGLRKHIMEEHGKVLTSSEHEFYSHEEFQEWKTKCEAATFSLYVLQTSATHMADGAEKNYYICHRSYEYRSKGKNVRSLKIMGSNKIGYSCPSTMEVTARDNRWCVKFWATHVGHSIDIGRVYLTREERTKIAGQLQQGVSAQHILDGIRDSLSNEEDLQRIHLIKRKDIHNIIRDFNIAYSSKHHQDVTIIEPDIVVEINDEVENTTDADNDFDTAGEEVHKHNPDEHLEFSLPKRPCVQTKNQGDPKNLDPAKKKKRRDDCRTFGEHVANKLSTYDSRIQAIVQQQINSILLEAEKGQYSYPLPEQWSVSPASSPSSQEEETVLASSPATHSRQEISTNLQLALPQLSSSQPYLEVVKEEEVVVEQHLPHSESLEEEKIPELGSPHQSASHHLDTNAMDHSPTNAELHGTDNSICNQSCNKAVESRLQTICDTVGKLMGNIPSLQKEDEFDIFGRSVAVQLRTLPFVIALETQLKLQSILTKMRLIIEV